MMRGVVNARLEAIVRLRLKGAAGVEVDIDFLIDTGFDSTLVLPKAEAEAIGLHYLGTRFANLADGTLQATELYLGQLQWNGAFTPVQVISIGDEALVGMGLLNGNELRIEVTSGGMVEINQLP